MDVVKTDEEASFCPGPLGNVARRCTQGKVHPSHSRRYQTGMAGMSAARRKNHENEDVVSACEMTSIELHICVRRWQRRHYNGYIDCSAVGWTLLWGAVQTYAAGA